MNTTSALHKRGGIAVVGMTVLALSGFAWAQRGHYDAAREPQAGMDQQMHQQMHQMQPDETEAQQLVTQRQTMMEHMKVMDQKLSDLVATMRTATGSAKVDAIANVVTELVAQRGQIRGLMSTETGMMSHMMEHVATGSSSAAGCPLVKGMADAMSGHSNSQR